jgi:rRNA maturation endonuclease Nob1
MVKKLDKIMLRCVGCKATREITTNQFAKGKPFCPKCGNMELVVEAVSQ